MTNSPIEHYNPPPFLKNNHAQNIISSLGIRKFLLKRRYRRLLSASKNIILQTPEKVRLMAQLNLQSEAAHSCVILIHGWEGSSESAYILSMAGKMYSAGHDTLRLHLRDHGDTTHLNKNIFNSSMIDEVVAAIRDFQKRHPYTQYHLVGFSLGGNFALRIGLHAHKLFSPLKNIMAICPVLDPAHTMVAMNNTLSFYDYYFAKKWKRSLRQKTKHFPEYTYLHDLNRMRKLDEMNDYFIPGYTPFENLPEYYDSYTLTGNRLADLKVPCLIIASQDDPIIPISDYKNIALSKNTRLEITRYGAHCAYLSNWKFESWLDERALTFFSN